MPNWLVIPFIFAVGACVGSFLNVVVYRLPRGISLVTPPSRCQQCETRLAWYDNIPVLGWILLAGKCRYCKKPISPVYPIIEAITGSLFVFYYVMLVMVGLRPPGEMTLPIYGLYMVLIAGLLAASLIDAELYIIPVGIPWWLAAAGVIVHAAADQPTTSGSLLQSPAPLALCAGAVPGLILSIILLQQKIIPLSFPEGDLLESERIDLKQKAQHAHSTGEDAPEIPPEFTPTQVRAEIRKEMLFLMPPLILGAISVLLEMNIPAVRTFWRGVANIDWLNAGMGALLGGLVGAFIVWLTRILGSYIMGKEAMGLGDVHLMLGIGAILGGAMATITFFIAPFAGIIAGLYLFITRSRRQLPYGPYLSLAAAAVMLFYAPIADYLRPGVLGLLDLIRH